MYLDLCANPESTRLYFPFEGCRKLISGPCTLRAYIWPSCVFPIISESTNVKQRLKSQVTRTFCVRIPFLILKLSLLWCGSIALTWMPSIARMQSCNINTTSAHSQRKTYYSFTSAKLQVKSPCEHSNLKYGIPFRIWVVVTYAFVVQRIWFCHVRCEL